MRKLLLLLLLITIPTITRGQSTSVSATITDAGGVAWVNGTYTFTSAAYPSIPIITGTLDSNGAFTSITFPTNATTASVGSQWTARICPLVTSPCFSKVVVIPAGPILSLTSSLIPPAITIDALKPPPLTAYADSEIINAVQGSRYLNLTDKTEHVCTALPCSSNWQSTITSGGSGSFSTLTVSGTTTPLGPLVSPYTPKSVIADYGAKCDGRIVTDWTQSSGSTSFSTASGALTQADVGKLVGINNGTSGAPNALLSTTIATVTSGTTGTTAAAPTRAITPAAGGGDGWAAIGTDDSAALNSSVGANRWVTLPVNQKCVYKSSLLVQSVSNFNLSGFGSGSELVFIPVAPLNTGINNAAIFLQSNFSNRRAITSASITVGATTFTAAAGDISDLLVNDWLVVTEGDAGAGEVVVADWVQVQSAVGTTVTVKAPFRSGISQTVAFDNARNPFVASPPQGLGFFRVLPTQIVSNIKIRDLRITAPVASATQGSLGVYSYTVKDAEYSGLFLNVGRGQPFATYVSKGLDIHDNILEGIAKIPSEIGATVDFSYVNNHISSAGTALDSLSTGATFVPNGGPTVDYGSAFGVIGHNRLDRSGNTGMLCNAAHDLTYIGNTIGYVQNVSGVPIGINSSGCYNNLYIGNILSSADTGGTAFNTGNSVGFTVTMTDLNNNFLGNFAGSTWATAYSLSAVGNSVIDLSNGVGARLLGNKLQINGVGATFFFDHIDTGSQFNWRFNGVNKMLLNNAALQAAVPLSPTVAGAQDLGTTTLPWGVTRHQAAPTGTAGLTANGYDSTTGTEQHNSNNNGASSFSGAWQCTNVTPVTVSANSASPQNLMSCSVPSGTLNRVGRTLRIWLSGVYSTPAASTTAVVITVKLGTLTLATWTSTALAGIQATNDQWNVTGWITTQTAGATASFEAHGNMDIDLGVGNTVADSNFADVNTATVGTLDITAAQTLQVTFTTTVGQTAGFSASQRQMVLETVN